MYNTAERAVQTITPTPFPFLDLPAEIRLQVYSLVVVNPITQPEDTHAYQDPKIITHHCQQRKVCHQTAKSLRLTSKSINAEVTALFFRHKHIVLDDVRLRQLSTSRQQNIFHQFDQPGVLQGLRHLEFDLLLYDGTVSDDDETMLNDFFMGVRPTERFDEHLLHRLQNITLLLKQAGETISHLDDITLNLKIKTRPCTNYDYDSSSPYHPRKLASQSPTSTTWDDRHGYINYLYEDAVSLYKWAEGLIDKDLPKEQWACTKTLYMSHFRDEQEYFLHELKFRRQ